MEIVVMKLTRRSLAGLMLLAAAGVGCMDSVGEGRRLSNGVYAVLREGLSSEEVRVDDVPHAVLIYDRKYSESDKNEPPKYVAIDTSSFVPLVLAGPPDAQADENGRTLLQVTLAEEHVKTLEEFTHHHLNGRVSIVLGGEIITMHKVRSVIRDGRVQITRCADDACKTLLLKLVE